MAAPNRSLPARDVARLFAWALARAIERLSASDVAALTMALPQRVAPPWLSASGHAQLTAIVQALAGRPNRWTLSGPTSTQIVAALGGEPSLENGQTLFTLARTIDEHYDASTFTDAERSWFPEAGISSPPIAFFDGATNLPPPIGRMASAAAVRPWFKNLWLVPSFRGVSGIGRIPAPKPVVLDAVVMERLQRAAEDRVLRVGLVTWRRHHPANLTRAQTPEGTFAVTGMATPAPTGLAARLVEQLVKARVHVALLPELALDDVDEAAVRAALAGSSAAYPVITIAGLSHRPGRSAHVNHAVALRSDGVELFRHEKLEPFTEQRLGLENILPREAEEYAFADTPIGRLVVNTCRDFRSDVATLLNRALEATLIFVPTYSKRLDFVAAEATHLGQRHLASTFAVNPIVDGGLDDALYAYAPIKGRSAGAFAGEQRFPQKNISGNTEVSVHVYALGFGAKNAAEMRDLGYVSL